MSSQSYALRTEFENPTEAEDIGYPCARTTNNNKIVYGFAETGQGRTGHTRVSYTYWFVVRDKLARRQRSNSER